MKCAPLFPLILLPWLLGLSPALAESPTLLITEVMPSNATTLADEDGETVDWIEVHNRGTHAIALDAYCLTDDPELLDKWRFPSVALEPGAFAVVFASGKGRAVADQPLHTNFKLDRQGEFLALVLVEEKRLVQDFGPALPKVHRDMSFGIHFDGGVPSTKEPGVLSEPTPGKGNVDDYAPLRTADTKFNIDRGVYDAPFDVYLRTDTPGAAIRYTLDGSTPSPDHGDLYEQPIRIAATTILRAMAYKEGHLPSNVDTHTYLFPDDVIRQPASAPAHWEDTDRRSGWRGFGGRNTQINRQLLSFGMTSAEGLGVEEADVIAALTSIPSISLVTDHKHLFDARSGIYVNARQRGRDWERPVSAELIDPTGKEDGFQIDAGVRIRGGHSRQPNCPKHAFRLYFRQDYGAGKLKYPLFGDEGADAFDDVDLRSPQNYSYHYNDDPAQNTFLREVFSRDSQRDLGQPYTRSRYYHLYLNGVYWGLYQTQEHAEASYASTYFGGEPEDYDVVKADWGRRTEVTDGDAEGWLHLWQTANRIASTQDAEERLKLYFTLQGLDASGQRNPALPIYLDVQNLTDYMLVIFLVGSFDAPVSNFMNNRRGNNWFGIWDRKGRRGFQFFCHDTEHSLGSRPDMADTNRVGPFPAGEDEETSNPQWIHQQLMAVDAYRRQFAARAEEVLLNDGPLSLEANLRRLEQRVAQVDKAILGECARWGAQRRRPALTKSDWLAAVERVRESLIRRADLVPEQLRAAQRYETGNPFDRLVSAGLFNPVGIPIVHRPGDRTASFRVPDDVEGVIYYTLNGQDPRHSEAEPHRDAASALPDSHLRHVLVGPDTPVKAFVPLEREIRREWPHNDFDDSHWLEGRGGVGYDSARDYASWIGLDVRQYMYGIQTTIYTRSAFVVEDLGRIDGLRLRLKFEDGFVAYLNGERICEMNAPVVTRWNSAATSRRDDGAAVKWMEFDISHHKSLLRQGMNLLAIHGLNDRSTSSDLLILPELHALENREGTRISIEPSPHGILQARLFANGAWSPLVRVQFEAPASAAAPHSENLTISEIMYHPAAPSDMEARSGFDDADEFEFIELMNIGDTTIDLAGVQFTDGVEFTFQGPYTLESRERCVLVRNRGAFATRYGDEIKVAGNYSGGLKNEGETLAISNAEGIEIARVTYRDNTPWPPGADGLGFSLVLIDPMANPALDNPRHWQASNEIGGSPGSGDEETAGGVLINEVLAHTDWPLVDTIELYNPTDTAIDVSGWFLTDDVREPRKYQIVAGSIIPPDGYLVIKEDNDDNPDNNESLPPEFFGRGFSLSSYGEQAYIFAAKDGALSGYSHGFSFDASENGVSFGRHVNSAGKEQFPPQKHLTLGNPNAGPEEAPVVISEIHYHPLNDDSDAEFMEIWNRSKDMQLLYDPKHPENTWQVDGVRFHFPAQQWLAPNEVALLVKTDPATFRRRFSVPESVKVYGPLEGALSNKGERLRLLRPDTPDVTPEETTVPMVAVDSVRYNDKAPWPEAPDGTGPSLERKPEAPYSDDPEAWKASEQDGGTPGRVPGFFEPKVTHAAPPELEPMAAVTRETPMPSEPAQNPSRRIVMPAEMETGTTTATTWPGHDPVSTSATRAVWGGIAIIGLVTLIPLLRRLFF